MGHFRIQPLLSLWDLLLTTCRKFGQKPKKKENLYWLECQFGWEPLVPIGRYLKDDDVLFEVILLSFIDQAASPREGLASAKPNKVCRLCAARPPGRPFPPLGGPS